MEYRLCVLYLRYYDVYCLVVCKGKQGSFHIYHDKVNADVFKPLHKIV